MSLDLSNRLSVRVINSNIKSGSGILYKRSGFAYVITAKHCICPKIIIECIAQKRECNNCLLEKSYSVKKTKISIDKPGEKSFYSIKPKDIISLEKKDLAIVIIKEKDLLNLVDIPELSIEDYRDLPEDGTYVSHGFPMVTNTEEIIPVTFDLCSIIKNELYFRICSNISANLESSKYNMDAASGMGVLCNKTSSLAGIYVKTDDFGGSYSEYIDESVNNLLSVNNYNTLDIKNNHEKIKTLITNEFLNCFEQIKHDLFIGKNRNLELYTIKIQGKSINYSNLIDRIHECVHLFCIPRRVIYDLESSKRKRKLIKDGDKEFINLKSDSKVSDLMLQGFLEAKYGMPKLFSSMVGKADTKGIHVNINNKERHELVHGVSHFSEDINVAFSEVIEKLYECACGTESPTELISSTIFDSTFNEEEKKFLVSFLIPSENNIKLNIIDTYAILIGFNVNTSSVDKLICIEDYKLDLLELIINTVTINVESLINSINKVNTLNTEIKIFFVPFEDVVKFKEEVIKGL